MASARTLHGLFEEQAAATPDRVAVVAGGRSLTYTELNARANAVAARLRAAGVVTEDLVGLCLERGPELVVGMLGILKAGAAYLPIDPSYPAERITFLLRDGGVSAVVTGQEDNWALPARTRVVRLGPDDDRGPASSAPGGDAGEHNLAYVIYTSGSTGAPKGVLVEHRSVVSLFEQSRDLVRPSAEDVWSLFHSMSFDFSVWEIWGALLHGGRLVIASAEEARSPQLLRALLVREGVTVLSQTPSVFSHLVAAECTSPPDELSLRLVVFGGERLEVKLLEPWFDRYGDQNPVLLNMYGITETTVHVTHRRITRLDADMPGVSPIGVPLPMMGLELLDEDGNSVPDGTPGEIWVRGPGVARGYHQRPDLTAERFVTRGHGAESVRTYRSGDRAVRTATGEYLYLGRGDDQVKVRGFRVEPREIEVTLISEPAVSAVVVTAENFGDGDIRLIAYVVPRPDTATIDHTGLVARLRKLADARLPDYLRPSAVHVVSSLPLTTQGKVDRAALRELINPVTASQVPDNSSFPEAPTPSGTAEIVREVVAEVLRRPRIGADDDFFEVGGTSLALMRIIAQVNLRCGTSLTGAELADATMRSLVECVDTARN